MRSYKPKPVRMPLINNWDKAPAMHASISTDEELRASWNKRYGFNNIEKIIVNPNDLKRWEEMDKKIKLSAKESKDNELAVAEAFRESLQPDLDITPTDRHKISLADHRVRIVKSPHLQYIGKVGKCTKLKATAEGVEYTIKFGDTHLEYTTTNENGELEFFENDEYKMAKLSEFKEDLETKELLLEEAVREDYQYSFIDAFRFLMKGHTIKFANDQHRKFKLIDEQIVELREFPGFSSESMLKDKFYVEP